MKWLQRLFDLPAQQALFYEKNFKMTSFITLLLKNERFRWLRPFFFISRPDRAKSALSKNFHLNLMVSVLIMVENLCIMSLKWLQPFIYLPAQNKLLSFVKISKWPNFVNFHPIWFKLGMLVICNLQMGIRTFDVTAAIFRPTTPTHRNSHFANNFQISCF